MKTTHQSKHGLHRAYAHVRAFYDVLEASVSKYKKGPHNAVLADALTEFLNNNALRRAVLRRVSEAYHGSNALDNHNLPTTLLPAILAPIDADPRAMLGAVTEKRSDSFQHLVFLGREREGEDARAMSDRDLAVCGLIGAVEIFSAHIDGTELFRLVGKSPVLVYKRAAKHSATISRTSPHPAHQLAVEHGGETHVQDYRRTARVMACVQSALEHGKVTQRNLHIWIAAVAKHYFEGQPISHVALYVQDELEKLGASRPSRNAWKSATYRALRGFARYVREHFDPKELLGHGDSSIESSSGHDDSEVDTH